jgi:hypothetical protein
MKVAEKEEAMEGEEVGYPLYAWRVKEDTAFISGERYYFRLKSEKEKSLLETEADGVKVTGELHKVERPTNRWDVLRLVVVAIFFAYLTHWEFQWVLQRPLISEAKAFAKWKATLWSPGDGELSDFAQRTASHLWSDDQTIVRESLDNLGTWYSSTGRDEEISGTVPMAIADAMKIWHDDSTIQKLGCRALRVMPFDEDERAFAREWGALDATIAALKKFQDNPPLQKECTAAALNLVWNDDKGSLDVIVPTDALPDPFPDAPLLLSSKLSEVKGLREKIMELGSLQSQAATMHEKNQEGEQHEKLDTTAYHSLRGRYAVLMNE